MGNRLPLLTTAQGIVHSWEDHGDGSFTVHSAQDVAPLLEINKAMASHNDGWSPTREWRRAAHIPAILLLKWRQEIGSDPLHPANRAWLMRKLNDSDWRFLRTAPGRL
jgi:hypothetical protein